MDIKRYLLILIIIASLFLIIKTINEYKEGRFIGSGIIPQNTIVVSGKGEVSSPADIAQFSFSVREESKIVKDAQDTASKKNNNIIKSLREFGIEDRDIKTESYNIYPRYEQREIGVACLAVNCPPVSSTRILVGYEVSQTVSVKIRDLSRVGEVISSIGGLGVSDISSLNFSIDNEDSFKIEARQKAIKEAKEKAEQLAKDLGVDLVRVVNFSESGNYPMYRGVVESAMIMTKDSGVSPEIPVGENKIISNVTITYEIK